MSLPNNTVDVMRECKVRLEDYTQVSNSSSFGNNYVINGKVSVSMKSTLSLWKLNNFTLVWCHGHLPRFTPFRKIQSKLFICFWIFYWNFQEIEKLETKCSFGHVVFSCSALPIFLCHKNSKCLSKSVSPSSKIWQSETVWSSVLSLSLSLLGSLSYTRYKRPQPVNSSQTFREHQHELTSFSRYDW